MQVNCMDYLNRQNEIFLKANSSIDYSKVIDVASALLLTVQKDSNIYICGNGGSATTASHFAVDLGVGSSKVGISLKVFSLVDNSGAITATGNDLDFSEVFSSQIQHLGRKNDILILISASGNSQNLLNALDTAHNLQMETISFTGFDGGQLKEKAMKNIHVNSPIGEYGIVEDLHMSICHRITDLVRLGEQ